MNKADILKQCDRIVSYLNKNRLRDAFKELKHMSEGAMTWEVSDEINKAEEAYKLMLNYAMQGADDPARDSLYNNIVSNMYALLDRVVRQRLLAEESTLYYNRLRYEQRQPSETIAWLISQYTIALDKSSIYSLLTSGETPQSARENILEKERIERRIFERVWITHPLNSEDEETIKNALMSTSRPQHFQELLISALLMGALEFYDPRRLRILLTAYQSELQVISVKALIATLLTMHTYSSRINDSKTLNHIATVKEIPSWREDVKTAYLEFIRTRDTERISRKMQDELIPQMLKLRPDIYKKLNDSTAMIDMSSTEENPEWEEMLQNSGITDKIKELSQLQEEGGDVFMSTFSHLKTFPFFSEIANWFLPFSLDHSLVNDTLGSDVSVMGEIINHAPFLCNSDKYSFLLSLGSIPQQQRRLMLSQFEQQRDALNAAGMSAADLTQPQQRKNIMNKYLQDLYRFFKLFRRKGEFYDPFRQPVNLINVPVLSSDIDDVDTLTLVAEFYFNRKYYNDALNVFLSIIEKVPPAAQLFQKIGYCYHQDGNVEMALKYYEQAELLNSDSIWTLRRIGACYRTLGNPQKALEYYEQVAAKKPDDLNVALNIGHCYLELGDYREAAKNYYKVEFLDEKTTRAWRPLAWCLLLSRDFAQSQNYYDRITTDNPTTEDFLNMGHLALAQNNIQGAIDKYKQSIEDGNIDKLIESLNKDECYLKMIGVDTSLMPFIVDAILYSID